MTGRITPRSAAHESFLSKEPMKITRSVPNERGKVHQRGGGMSAFRDVLNRGDGETTRYEETALDYYLIRMYEKEK